MAKVGEIALARRMASFAAQAEPPPDVLEAVARHLLDTLGICLAAYRLRHRPRIEETAALLGAGASTAIGLEEPASAAAAAFHNGCFAHALEADDTHTGSVMHGSSILVPAAFAAAEEADADGSVLLRSIAVGWEIMIRIGLGFPAAFFKNGFHATALAGPYGAAAAAAVAQGLDEDRIVSALGIAGSQSGGLFEFLEEGAESKWLHAGWPALGGLLAAKLAAGGMRGPETIFEGRAGFATAFARSGADGLSGACDDLGVAWHCRDVAAKLYPTCHFIQPFLECLENLLRDTAPDRIETLTCFVPAGAASLICQPWEQKLHPATAYQAKWSLPYCLAALLVDGRIEVGTFDRPDPDGRVLERAKAVRFEIAEAPFPEHYPGRVQALLSDGSQRSASVEDVLGSASRPLAPERLIAKFRTYAGPALLADGADAIMEAVERLRHSQTARQLGQVIRASVARNPHVPQPYAMRKPGGEHGTHSFKMAGGLAGVEETWHAR